MNMKMNTYSIGTVPEWNMHCQACLHFQLQLKLKQMGPELTLNLDSIHTTPPQPTPPKTFHWSRIQLACCDWLKRLALSSWFKSRDDIYTAYYYFTQILPSSDLSSSQLKNKINNNFWPTGHRVKIQKAKLVRIKFSIELCNFYFTKTFFCIELFLPH